VSPTLFSNGLDVSPLTAIHAQCFAEAWNARAIGDLLATPGTFVFAAENGFILVRAGGGEAEVLTLAVAPDARRYGTGTALVEAAAHHALGLGARVLFLEVGVGNLPARSLYERLGFALAGRRKHYYTAGAGKPEDALVLRSDLPLSPLGKSPAAG
jgi:ribosomal-protein-alanine N-acetyltransferase